MIQLLSPKIDQNMIGIFCLSGASAYFLRKDFGSAKVLAARVVDLIDEERSPQKLLTNIYNYLLGGVYLPYLRVIDTYERINNFFFGLLW